jgi:membrane protease YdiL (CAAX protease family)
MFNRYWRSYPWFFQLFQLIILLGVLFSFFVMGLGSVLVPMATGYTLTDTARLTTSSPYLLKQAVLLAQLLYSVGTFLLPPLLFAYATHPRPTEYLGLRKPGKAVQWPVVIMLITGLVPVFLQVGNWISKLPWSPEVKAGEAKLQELTNALTSMNSPVEFIKIFALVAILPAVGEELLFRGVFMRFAAKRSGGIVFPLIVSALMFALAHSSMFGFLPILMAGIVLGLIYYWTGSIWLSILAHMINNGVQLVMLYIGTTNKEVQRIMDGNNVPIWLFIPGLLLASFATYLLWRNRTPLPPTWSSDYTAEELMEGEQ